MQVVIDIDEYDYKRAKQLVSDGVFDYNGTTAHIFKGVANGTPLQKVIEKKRKPFWQTDEKCEYGYFADLTKLPIGTVFDVVNGAWEGKIVEKDNQKYLLCSRKYFHITDNEHLVIDNVRIEADKEE